MASLGNPPVNNLPQIDVSSAREESEPNETAGAVLDDGRERHLEADPYDLRDKIQKILNNNPIGLDPEGHYLLDDKYDTLFQPDDIQKALGGSYTTRPFDRICLQNCTHYFRYHDPWDLTQLNNFKRERWQFLVPTFDTEKFIYEFDNDRILPFIAKSGELPSGHFSDVACVEMLASKQKKVNVRDNTIIVALKTLRRISDPGYDIHNEWHREAKAHKQLNGKRDHIIQAFAAYQQKAARPENNTYHLVLEWADGGSPHDFWDKSPARQLDHLDVEKSRQRVTEMLEQVLGIADALEGMHSTSSQSPGRHSRRGSTRSSPERLPVRNVHGREDGLDAGVPFADSQPLPKFNLDVADETRPYGEALRVPILSVSPPDPASLEVNGGPNPTRRTTNFNSENWRHGDIKPQNILRFTDGKADAYLGVLKLADLGRAQQHLAATNMRDTKEKELWRTRWYEPPDLEEKNYKQAKEKISRLFDIWSMGCVIFEIVLWFLYGHNSVGDFLSANKLTTGEPGATPYWRKGKGGEYKVSNAATSWMENILEHDPERNGAIGHLVKLVSERLLKIHLPQNSDVYEEGFRTNAKDLREQLELIIANTKENESYLFSGADRTNVPLPEPAEPSTNGSPQSTGGSSLSPYDAQRMNQPPTRGQRTAIVMQREYTNRLEGEWKTIDDNAFVGSNVAGRHSASSVHDLCLDCKGIDILSSKIDFEMGKLKSNSDEEECDLVCDLCELVYTAAKDLNLKSRFSLIRSDNGFILDGTDLKVYGTDLKVLRLCCNESATEQATGIPIGAPKLPTPSDPDPPADTLDSFIELPQAWLQDCNLNHRDVCAPRRGKQILPKRLISVEHPKKSKIIETAALGLDLRQIEYIAFSHKWGDMPVEAVTMKQNLDKRKINIPLKELPLSFKNAMAITRALKCTYLWIDSLCILQGPDGDFDEQADKMQTTFSRAYCVLAACNAMGAKDGFLQVRKSRYVEMGNVFVSPVTNDFERDVLNSPLNRRGWVLQERALARRTIFFTESQMYWECGDGIRCETWAKLKNDKIAFLGDANFPNYTIRLESTVGEQIDLFIDLFQRYTRLNFSHPEDRPIAIDGLIERLTEAFKTQSLAGLFETFWGRCLLWRRADGVKLLKKIPRGPHTRKIPPTWSWMAFEGEISFVKPEGGQVYWNDPDVILPFGKRTQASWLRTSQLKCSMAIQAKALDFEIAPGAGGSEALIFYDGGKVVTSASTKCVIIGSEKQQASDAGTKKHYVLIVKAISDAHGTTPYERVGVGYLLGKFILLNRPSIPIVIE
ncbi:uncharacterized protein BP5553_06525 [Venustampulla echinocandica]|uniref:Protein kinase domain-containing protein n=1 Tax=Venustampulla echinocandica TaxID=2656787 RepID=A0A370TK64_9HELO|nr:uncharacterized protein BP5553_06525 [Venustampulla echinocandica]RDL35913.1 hypothetical protein BP5553_06525 [Venustampulla echinocandica]